MSQEKHQGRSLGHRAWFTDMGFKELPKDWHITPMKIVQVTLDGPQGTVVASAKMEMTERQGSQDHPVKLIHTDTFRWHKTPPGWRLASLTSTPQALRDGKPARDLMIWLPERDDD